MLQYGFRALKSAAPLKPRDTDQRDYFKQTGFRALKSAAPLKQIQPLLSPSEVLQFPRPQKRGPVEASLYPLPLGSRTVFPRPQKRGPVEATLATNLSISSSVCFRALKSAAPLKPLIRSVKPKKIMSFPRPQKRGPVEA